MGIEHYYSPVDLSLWDVCKPHINDEKLKEIELLHIFGEGGSYAIFVTADDKVYATSTYINKRKCYLGFDYKTPNKLVELTGFNYQNIKCFSSGHEFTIALTKDGRLLSCGVNDCGQLGVGDRKERIGACSVINLEDETIVSIQCGSQYCLALSSCNEVYRWGWIGGSGSQAAIESPRLIQSFQTKNICEISCSCYNYAALTQDGNMYQWSTSGVVDTTIMEVSAIGCSSDGFIYIQNGNLFKNQHFIAKADDFVVHHDYICFKIKENFYLVKDVDESPELITVSDFQSAFANQWCPQFVRRSFEVSPFRTKNEIISDRNIYKALYNNKDLSDLTIKLSNGVIYVHKTVLMCFSEHFKQLLTGPWAASNSTEMDMTTYSPLAYEALLKYVYSGILYDDELTGSDLIDLHNIAESYFENDLKEHVLNAFKDCLTIENVCELYSLADKQMPLVEECLKLACIDPLNTIATEGYRKMEPEFAKSFSRSCVIRNLQL